LHNTFLGSESEEDKITSFDESFAREDDSFCDTSHNSQQHLHNQENNSSSQISVQQSDASSSKATKDDSFSDVMKKRTIPLDRATPDGVSSKSKSKDEPAVEPSSSSNPPCPYLITLQGNEDNLIHSLDKQEVLIGSDVTDFKLVAPDVLHHHCVIKKRLEVVFSEKDNFESAKRWCVTINPLNPDAEVRINGGRVTTKHSLQHGEMLSVGKHHLFMYKDPSSHINLSSLVNLSYRKTSVDSDNSSTKAHGSNTSLHLISSPHNERKEIPKLLDFIETLLNYRVEHEDEILQDIFNYISNFDNPPNKVVLFPATLLSHCVIHSSLNFTRQAKTDLLLKIASTTQTLVLVRKNYLIMLFVEEIAPKASLYFMSGELGGALVSQGSSQENAASRAPRKN